MDGGATTERVLEDIPRDRCLTLLATESIGRLAVNGRTGPMVVPVNYILVGEAILFRSGSGTKLRAIAARPVSFQVDHFDHDLRQGWSVLVRGRAREVSGRQFSETAPDPWVAQGRDHWVSLTIVAVTGRRITSATPKERSGTSPPR